MRAMMFMVWGLLVPAQPASSDVGILVMAHGGSAEWNSDVEQVVAPLRDKYPISIAYGMARTSTLQEAVKKLEAQGVRRIAVVRLFISADSFVETTEYILGLRDALPADGTDHHGGHHHAPQSGPGGEGGDHDAGHHGGGHHMEPPKPIETQATFVLSRQGVGASPLVDAILVDRVKALSKDPSRECVLILAHGPGNEAENERWLANMRMRAQGIHPLGEFKHIQCETLREDWPSRRTEAERRIKTYVASAHESGTRVIVVPFRIAGFGPYAEVLSGLEYVADGRGFCPHPNLTRWIEAAARECFAGFAGGGS